MFMRVPGPFWVAHQNCGKFLWHLCSSSHCFSVYTNEDSVTTKKLFSYVDDKFSFVAEKLQNSFLASVINETLRLAKSGVKAFVHAIVVNSIDVCR